MCIASAGNLTQLSWSANSELLAVVLSAPDQQQQQQLAQHQEQAEQQHESAAAARVQIWHRSNWHWYLKQEQVYEGRQMLSVYWDPVVPLRLHVLSDQPWYRQVRLSARALPHLVPRDVCAVGSRLCFQPCTVSSLKPMCAEHDSILGPSQQQHHTGVSAQWPWMPKSCHALHKLASNLTHSMHSPCKC